MAEPTVEEVHLALDTLQRAGWRVQVDEGYGILSDLGPEFGTILQMASAPHPAAKRYVRGCAQEPWKEKR